MTQVLSLESLEVHLYDLRGLVLNRRSGKSSICAGCMAAALGLLQFHDSDTGDPIVMRIGRHP